MQHNRVSPIYIMIMGYNILRLCSCAGSFEIRLVSLTVGSKRDFRPELRICLKHFERHISHNGDCTFGEVTLDADRLRNGTKIKFEFGWPGSFTLITEAWRSTGSLKELIFHDGFQRENVPLGKHWIEETLKDENGFRMTIAYKITCASDFYGPRCLTFCQPMSNTVGHFECTSNGTWACSAGWEGSSCDIARCDNCVNGACDRPGSCRCKTGWTGPSCDQCVRYPGCKHGTCKQPNQCICDEGWGGHFCNEDLNYCTRHGPCKNGATCRNTGHGQYTCECSDGYTGTNCETRLQNCSLLPCLNGATCVDMPGNNYTCMCPSGYTGRFCQLSASSCADNPCQNGATCTEIRAGASFVCSCLPGWTGVTCDIEIGPCNRVQCFNGGKCVEGSSAGSYDCICPLGFTGRHCEENANECAQFNPCMNGGRCIDEVNNYKCQCPDGFSGTLCQDSISACLDGLCLKGCDRSPCRNGGTCIHSLQGFHCLCPPCFYGDSCLHFDPRCRTIQRHNRTGVLQVRTENEQQASKGGSSFRDLMLILLSSCCMLTLMLVAIIYYRQKIAKRITSADASLQNDLNSRRLSKYSEQKPCLSVCTGQNAENSYFERDRTCKIHTLSGKKRLSLYPPSEDLDYSERYAIEPTVSLRLPLSKQELYSRCHNKAEFRPAKCPDITRSPLPTPPSQDGDSYYEEIDNVQQQHSAPKGMVTQRTTDDSDSGIASPRATLGDRGRRRLRDSDEEMTDIQTNL